MDGFTFIVDLVRFLAWPVGVVILAGMFSPQIRDLLARLTHVKASGVEFDFSEKLDAAERTMSLKPHAQPGIVPHNQAVPPSAAQTSPTVTASLPPDYIIQQAWQQVDGRLRSLAAARGIALPGGADNDKLAGALDLQDDTRAVIEQLRSMRNAAIHLTQVTPTRTDALRYTDLVDALLTSLPPA